MGGWGVKPREIGNHYAFPADLLVSFRGELDRKQCREVCKTTEKEPRWTPKDALVERRR